MPNWTEIRSSIVANGADVALPPSVKLPVLPKALSDFRKLSADPDADTNQLSQIVSSDAGLSAELLRNVNSCKLGSGRAKVTSVKQALMTLGIKGTLMHLTTSALKESMKSTSSKLINFQNFWNTNLERSLFAKEVAAILGADTELAFTSGMIQDFLLPMITNQLVEDYLEFAENRVEFSSLVAFEQEKFGWNHAQASAHILHAWHFPDELICCVHFHHQGMEVLKDKRLAKTSVAAAAISSFLTDALRQEPNGLDHLIELDKRWADFDLHAIATKVDREFQELSENASNHIPFVRVLENALKRRALQTV